MQLATSVNDEPWACNLHFYADDDLNLYWISSESRKHSEDIVKNPQIAVAIMIHENTREADYVIGISMQGIGQLLGSKVDKKIAAAFIKKHKEPSDYLDNVLDGSSSHKFYCLRPTIIVLFDSKNFPKDPRQEISI